MTRTTRSRSYVTGDRPSGSIRGLKAGVPFVEDGSTVSSSYGKHLCNDSHGRPIADSSLFISAHDPSKLGTVSGLSLEPYTPNSFEGHVSNFMPAFMRTSPLNSHLSLPSMPSASSHMATLLARTNPSRPQYVPLELLQDIVDVPKMLKEAGHFLTKARHNWRHLSPKDLANQHLAFLFGWLPLVNDLKELLNVNIYIQKRMGELERLYSDRGLKRRIRLGEWTSSSDNNVVVNSSAFCNITCRQQTLTRAFRWGSVRWRPSTANPNYHPSHLEMLQQAQRVVSGFTNIGLFQGAWDLLPWTFLIDWGVNVKDFVTQYANEIPASPEHANVLTSIISKRSWTKVTVPKGLSYSPGSETYVTKERYVGSGTLSAHIPMLDMGRLSILSSLSIQRVKADWHF